MSTQYRLVQSGKTASGGCSAGQGSSEPVAPRIIFFIIKLLLSLKRIVLIVLISLNENNETLRGLKWAFVCPSRHKFNRNALYY
jgi:hypothetical protein